MKKLFLVFLLLFLVGSYTAWGMFKPSGSYAKRPRPGGEGLRFSLKDKAPRAGLVNGKPRKEIELFSVYLEGRPPLKAAQKAALKTFAPDIPGLKVHFDPRTGLPVFLKGAPLYRSAPGIMAKKGTGTEAAFETLNQFRTLLRIKDPREEFVLRRRLQDKTGALHLRLSQRYKGIPYFGKELTVHLNEKGEVYLIAGRYAETPEGLETTPLVSAVEAAEKAKALYEAEEVYLTELTIFEDRGGIPHLAWRVEVYRGVEGWRVFVDARTGQILEKYALAYEVAVPGSGQDEQTGTTHHFSVWQESGTYFFIDTETLPFHTQDPSVANDDFGAGNIVILTLPYGTLEGGLAWLSSSDPNSWPPAAVSVWYGLKETLLYYYQTFGRQGMDGEGSSVKGAIGLNQANAFYAGPDFMDLMCFGTGDGYQMAPLTALDVVAHEFTHGITAHTAALEYRYQSGALNEAFSDIFAAMVDREDWLIGEDVVLVPPYCLRNLEDPHQSLQPQPATMDEYQDLPINQDHGGVHINATIPAHTAYLIAQRIGRERAEKIFYRALTVHLTPQSEFQDFCLALAQSAEELFGANSQEREAVVSACNEVGIIQGEIGGGGEENLPEIPPAPAGDYLLFIFADLDPFTGDLVYYLGELTPDRKAYLVTERPVHPSRPAPYYAEGPGYVLFIDQDNNLWEANILSETYEEYLLIDTGDVWSISTTPAKNQLVLTSTYDEDPTIYLLDLETNELKSYPIKFAPPDAQGYLHTYFPDVVSFSPDGHTVFFDCFNELTFRGQTYQFWTIGKLDLTDGTTTSLLAFPEKGYHIGNPAVAQTRPYLLAYDVWQENLVKTWLLNLRSGRSGLAWQGAREEGAGTSGWPYFTGDDQYLVVQDYRPEIYEVIVAVPILKQGDVWVGNKGGAFEVFHVEDAYGTTLPVVYRPGERNVAPRAEISPARLDFGNVPVGGEKRLSLTLTNTGNYPFEFRGSEIEGEAVFAVQAFHREIAPGESYQISVVFRPQEAKSYQALLRLFTSIPEQAEITVPLAGRGGEGGENILIDVKVNGSDGPLTLYEGDFVDIKLWFDPQNLAGQRGDYFLWAEIPGEVCYCFQYPNKWVPCVCDAPPSSYQGSLVPFLALQVATVPCQGLPKGSYTLHFAVDAQADGRLEAPYVEDTLTFEIR